MLLLWSIIFFIIGIILALTAFSGVAIAISFFTKIMFSFAFICFLVAFVLLIAERIKIKLETKRSTISPTKRLE